MPNTASAERRARSNVRRAQRNHSVTSRIKTLEKGYLKALADKQREEAGQALRAVSSALDKAAKTGVLHSATASRKKSRLATKLAALA
ncbi:MAG: 30S ribosomal protein S20 [Verrucomicrobiales bacterium]|nr:30S ribosomal protein S20 [Verrucomicrobiales bacterium]